jgi:hypothetical protein
VLLVAIDEFSFVFPFCFFWFYETTSNGCSASSTMVKDCSVKDVSRSFLNEVVRRTTANPGFTISIVHSGF